jgi:hypothetical protein
LSLPASALFLIPRQINPRDGLPDTNDKTIIGTALPNGARSDEKLLHPYHPLRVMRGLVNSAPADLSTACGAFYSPFGRDSIPPERLLRAALLQAFYSIRSERQLVERIEFDLLFRWFVGIGVDPHVTAATEGEGPAFKRAFFG